MSVEGIEYSVTRRRRKTVEIAVHPDGRVEVAAPEELSGEKIAELIQKRSVWIRRKQDFFDGFGPRGSPRRYVAGETQLYLGKPYRLRLEKGQGGVSLADGYMVVTTPDTSPTEVGRLIGAWSRHRARIVFSPLLDAAWASCDQPENKRPRLCIKVLARRWGSLSEHGTLTLNLALIQAPKACIEYVIVHELCHIGHPGHGPDFYAALEKAMPDWEERKERLEHMVF